MSPEGEDHEGPRRYLIATATAHYKNNPAWDRPGLVQARLDIIDLFCGRFGYQHITDLGLDPTEHQVTERLREFCKSPQRRADDLVALYIAGHGEVLDEDAGGGHVLLTHDSEPDDIEDALPTETLARKMLAGTRVRRLLLMLDTCYSGQGGNEVTTAALERMSRRWGATPDSGLVIMSSAQPLEQAATGFFPRKLREAAEDLATAGHGPQALALEAVVQRMNTGGTHQRVGLTLAALTGHVPPFLPNPRHAPQLTDVDLALQQEAAWQREADQRDRELDRRLLVRAMSYQGPDSGGWWFAGRGTALADITTWLSTPHHTDGEQADVPVAVRAVTAGPGSGKTAVLGIIAALAHPEVRHTVPWHSLGLAPATAHAARAVDVAVYAQTLTDDRVLAALAAAARSTATTPGELLAALADRERPLTALIDGLDEAATPKTLCTNVLAPLINHSQGRIRLLLGTRPHLLPALGLHRDQQIDLDSDRYADPQAVLTYTVQNLLQSHRHSPYRQAPPHTTRTVAAAVAHAADRSFLVARLTAGTLAAAPELPDPHDPHWAAKLPRHADQAMADDLTTRLGPDAERAADLLRPLAYAQGQGMPWEDLWAPIASAVSGRPYTDRDIRWLREAAGSYIIEAVEDDRSLYRLYHQALAEHLRHDTDPTSVHRTIARVLTDHVPIGSDGDRDWSRAHPYTLRHLATHAVAGGILDDSLTDPEYLVLADPDHLAPLLHHAVTDPALLAAAVYRSDIAHHRSTTPPHRRQILAISAARYNATTLTTALNSKAQPGTWLPRHATGSTVSTALRNTLTGHTGIVNAVACTTIDGRPVAVTGSNDGSVRVWDLVSGQPLGEPMIGHTGIVTAVACTAVDGRPVAVTGSNRGSVRVWDLVSGQSLGEPMTGHNSAVTAVACTAINGRPVAVTGSNDMSVRVWDLVSGQPLGQPMTGHDTFVRAVACTAVNGQPVAVTGSFDDPLRLWDLASGQAQPLTGRAGTVYAVACTAIDGQPVAVTCSFDYSVRVWDLVSRQSLGQPMTGHTDAVHAVACTAIDGQPVAVTCSYDMSVRVWDLVSGQSLGQPMTGHTEAVHAVACTAIDGRPVAVTGSNDGSVQVWDLVSGRPMDALRLPAAVWAVAVSASEDLVCAFGSDITIFRR